MSIFELIDPPIPFSLPNYSFDLLENFDNDLTLQSANSTTKSKKQRFLIEPNENLSFSQITTTGKGMISNKYSFADKSTQLIQPETFQSLSTIDVTNLQTLNSFKIFQSIEKVNLQDIQMENQIRSIPPPGFEAFKTSMTMKQPQKLRNVVYIRGFDNPLLKISNMYNLIRNFGQVVRLLFFKSKGALLAEFQYTFDASYCKQQCEGLKFCGNILKVFWSNHQQIEYKPSQDTEFWEQQTETIARNPPSTTIHVGNLKPEDCNEFCIKQIFSGLGQIQKIKFLLEKPYNNMCLIQFTTIEESVNAVSFYHNQDFFGRKLSVSFTKSQI